MLRGAGDKPPPLGRPEGGSPAPAQGWLFGTGAEAPGAAASPGRRDRGCAGQRLGARPHPAAGAAGRPLSCPLAPSPARSPRAPAPQPAAVARSRPGRCRRHPPATAGAQWRVPPLHSAARQPRHGGRGGRSTAPRAGGASSFRGRQRGTPRPERVDRAAGWRRGGSAIAAQAGHRLPPNAGRGTAPPHRAAASP